jgi:hypothetical protein
MIGSISPTYCPHRKETGDENINLDKAEFTADMIRAIHVPSELLIL